MDWIKWYSYMIGFFTLHADGGEGAGGGGQSGGEGAGGEGAGGEGAGGGGVDFASMIPDEFKGNPALADIKDLNGLLKSYVSSQQMLGDRVPLPKADSDAKLWDEFYAKLGVPSDAKQYDLGKIELPAGHTIDPELENFAKDLFKQANLTPQQAKIVFETYAKKSIDDYNSYVTKQTAKQEAEIASLRSEWGANFDINLEAAKFAARTIGGQDFIAWLDETGQGNSPAFIKTFHTISKMLKEDTQFRDSVGNGGFTAGPEQAKAEIARLQGDKVFMESYTNKGSETHMAAKQRMDNLWKTAYPGQIIP